jgi:(R,R)-butanediol dehydrogenase/meso-butanediol dehydrogenase/diacetyl reductase
MKAARYYGEHDIRIEEAGEPQGLGPGELLIKPHSVGICGTDLHEYIAGPIFTPVEPHPLTGATLPQILGHELSGEVVDIGDEVRNAKPGDRVAIMPLLYCGHCYYCVRGLNQLCLTMGTVGLSWDWGGLAEYAVVLDYQVTVLDDELSYEQGALMEPAAVATYAVERGGVKPGDTVLVTGLGPIGGLSILAAAAAGASEIYLSEPNPKRVRLAERLGVTEVFNPAEVDLAGELRERTGGLGVDVALECAGNGAALNACVESTRSAGTVSVPGLFTDKATVDPFLWTRNDLNIVGSWTFPVYGFPRIATQIRSGRLPVEKVITGRITGLEDTVPKGFDILTGPDGDQVKVLVEPN